MAPLRLPTPPIENLAANDEETGPPQVPGRDATPDATMELPLLSSPEPLGPRPRRLPPRYRELFPEPPTPALDPPVTSVRRVILHVFDRFRTVFNKFHIAREYHHRPTHDPDSFVLPEDLSTPSLAPLPGYSETSPGHSAPWPWPNMSMWRIMNWIMTGSRQKSLSEANRLVHDILYAPDFDIRELDGFDARREAKRLDDAEKALSSTDPFGMDQWKQANVDLVIPTREKNAEGNGVPFTVRGFRYRSLLDVICSVFAEASTKWFHLMPFKKLWKCPRTGQEQRVYDELYTSNAWIEAQDAIMKQKRTDGCKLERVVAGLMLWSDSTRLAQFGHVSAWPIYLAFGNLSKYARNTPERGSCQPVAFIPSLPESLRKFLSVLTNKKTHADLLAHCKRELIHAVWKILLDDDFVEAYKNGIIIKCFDGVTRRVYPRIFTYSADYPEKILLAAIRDKGICPCPRCLIPKSAFHRLGFLGDLQARLTQIRQPFIQKISDARRAIYVLGKSLKSTIVERILKPYSLVPTVNTFTERLSSHGFNIFRALVVDLLHEFELGIAKVVLKHLIRILYTIDPYRVHLFNERFAAVPLFGINGIRRFPHNVADISQRPARFFAAVVQCAMPVLEGLLPPKHDDIVQTLLFRLAEWHTLAKLRIHTEDSLTLLQQALRQMGTQMRRFQRTTCPAFNTKELPSETAQRQKRETEAILSGRRQKGTSSISRSKVFNINTYKFHALGDYGEMIRRFGTTDSYSTQVGERAHKTVKRFYGASNKKNTGDVFARQERRETLLRRQLALEEPLAEIEAIDPSPLLHYSMATAARSDNVLNILELVEAHHADPAIRPNFIQSLKDHLLSRVLGLDYDGDERSFSPEQRDNMRLLDLCSVIESKLLRVNYTTYDIRRARDTVRMSRGDIVMTKSADEEHPFWYAQTIRAFRIQVEFSRDGVSQPDQSMDVLWVRWLGIDQDHKWGLKEARLPKVGFVPDRTDHVPFGFLDPSLVIRGCHLIPAFSDGRTSELLQQGLSLARQPGEVDDWAAYYVNIFADRDIFARFTGIGVGHLALEGGCHVPTPEAEEIDNEDDYDDVAMPEPIQDMCEEQDGYEDEDMEEPDEEDESEESEESENEGSLPSDGEEI